jgi:hypothetical protein
MRSHSGVSLIPNTNSLCKGIELKPKSRKAD